MVQPNLSGKGKYTPPQEMVGRGVKIECKALIDQGLANFFCKGSVEALQPIWSLAPTQVSQLL